MANDPVKGATGQIPVAVEHIGGDDYQLVKPYHGTTGVATPPSATTPFPVYQPGIANWQDTSITTLGAAGTFTGPTRDLAGVAAATDIPTNQKFKEFRAIAISNVTGTLNLEVSRDGTTWRRILSPATVAVGSLFVAEIQHFPKMRYARVVYVNGAGAQTQFNLAEAQIGI